MGKRKRTKPTAYVVEQCRRCREVLSESGISFEKLALLAPEHVDADLHPNTIRKILTVDTAAGPRTELLTLICKVTNANPEYLLLLADKPKYTYISREEIAEDIRQLIEDDQSHDLFLVIVRQVQKYYPAMLGQFLEHAFTRIEHLWEDAKAIIRSQRLIREAKSSRQTPEDDHAEPPADGEQMPP